MNSDHLVVETVDAAGGGVQGAPGRVLLTDLHNYGMPMIRYENGDVAVTATRRCDCGRGLPLLERVEGRLLDIIRTPAGRILPGEFFPHLFKDLSWVREFQVIQREPAHLRVLLVLRPEGGPADLEPLRRKLAAVLGGALEIQIDTVAAIPRTASGKLRVTIGCGN